MKVLITSILCAICLNAYAQLQVKPNGHVQIGPNVSDIHNVPVNLLDTLPMLQINGRIGDMGQGGRIVIGDNSSVTNKNLIIGELGLEDCDIMWLHGKHGFYLTHNYLATDTIFFYDDNKGNFAQFKCDVKTTGLFLASDADFKSNINPIYESSKLLGQLNPVQYSLKSFALGAGEKIIDSSGSLSLSEKESKDMEFYKKFYADEKEENLRFGLLAQEVEKVFPNLVTTDNDGKKYVDYIGMLLFNGREHIPYADIRTCGFGSQV